MVAAAGVAAAMAAEALGRADQVRKVSVVVGMVDHRAAGGEKWHMAEKQAAAKKGAEGSTTAERRRPAAPKSRETREPSPSSE